MHPAVEEFFFFSIFKAQDLDSSAGYVELYRVFSSAST